MDNLCRGKAELAVREEPLGYGTVALMVNMTNATTTTPCQKYRAKTVSLNDIWVRDQGFSLKFKRLRALKQLPPAEQLLAALIRKDAVAAKALLDNEAETAGMMRRFLKLVQENRFAPIVLDRALELELVELSQIKSDDGISILTTLSQSAQREYILFSHSEGSLRDLMKILLPLSQSLLFVKGSHLCRSVYSQAQHRHYSDVDIITTPDKLVDVVNCLEMHQFRRLRGPAFSNQWGAGPMEHASSLTLAPDPQWIPACAVSLQRGFGLPVDLKVGSLDRGLTPIEFDRFFAEAETGNLKGIPYRAPAPADHLMIVLRNLEKDRFVSWKTLVDVHNLCEQFGSQQDFWQKFVHRSKLEHIATGAWVGLMMAVDRLATKVPKEVLSALAPNNDLITRYLVFGVSPSFVWNITSLPMLFLIAIISSDRNRKLNLLRRSFLPDDQFLSQYFADGASLSKWNRMVCLILHWLVLLLPAGVVRRTFGPRIWSAGKSTLGNSASGVVSQTSGLAATTKGRG